MESFCKLLFQQHAHLLSVRDRCETRNHNAYRMGVCIDADEAVRGARCQRASSWAADKTQRIIDLLECSPPADDSLAEMHE